MKKLSFSLLLIVLLVMGCGKDEIQNYSFASSSNNWDGEIQIEQRPVGSENEEIAMITVEYKGDDPEALADELITVSVIETGGSTAVKFEGLPDDGILEFDFSNSDLVGTLKAVDQLEIQVSWQENTESLFFEYNEE